MSLRDQLLQAGIATKKQHQQARTQKKIDKGQLSSTAEQTRLKEIKSKQLKRDKSLNKEREEVRAQKAFDAQIKQLVTTNLIVREKGDAPYHFTHNRSVKTICFSPSQHKKIITGQVAIVAFEEDKYLLVTDDTAEKVLEKSPDSVIVYNKNIPPGETKNEDDPYAEYKIPDDLMW